jgi:hypothetical protein
MAYADFTIADRITARNFMDCVGIEPAGSLPDTRFSEFGSPGTAMTGCARRIEDLGLSHES